jgi:ankyrin repeat protein
VSGYDNTHTTSATPFSKQLYTLAVLCCYSAAQKSCKFVLSTLLLSVARQGLTVITALNTAQSREELSTLTLHCCDNCTVLHSPDAEGIVYDPAPSRGTLLLHTAVLYSRADCTSLLLSAGVDATALSAEHTAALSQACLPLRWFCQKLLLQAGGWVRACGFSCL